MNTKSIPDHWKVVRLGEVTEIVKGGTPKRDVVKYFRGVIPWAIPSDITALDPALYISDTATHISEEALGKSAAKLLRPGTVLLTSRATIGETAIATVPMATNQGFANFICHETLLNVFLAYYLRYIKEKLNNLAGGSTFKEITKATLLNIEIPLFPLPEQRAIAEVLSDVDGLIGVLDALIAKKQAIKQATMQQLLTGRTRLPGFSGKWRKARIGDLLSYRRPDPYIVQSAEYLEHGDVPVLTANKSFVLGYTNESSGVCRNLPVIIFDDFTTDSKFATFPFKVKSSAIKLLYGKHERVNLKYVFERMQLIRFPLGNHKRYYISEYQNLEILVPDFDEQHAIAQILSEMDAEIAALEHRRDKARAIKQGMMQQLLTGTVRLVKLE